ncbi:MAG: hypothetical protein ABIQ13_02625 [Pedococcus sp.]
MRSAHARRRPVGAGVNSARGWSRIWRAYAVEALAVAVFVGLATLLYVVGLLTRNDWFTVWGLLVLGVTVLPLVALTLVIVPSVRLRVAPVGLVIGVLLWVWVRAFAPSADDPRLLLSVGLVGAPVVAALLTHPWRGPTDPGRQRGPGGEPSGLVDGPVDLQAGAADLDDSGVHHR